jgi:hypothetical protein
MCERAIKLQPYIDRWLEQEIALRPVTHGVSDNSDTAEADYRDLKKLQLAAPEWQHIRAVTHMLQNFKTATDFLSKNQKPQIPFIWLMYNRLFDFLDKMTDELGEETVDAIEWPSIVQAAAEIGRAKLTKYYAKTDEEQGFLYNVATVLDLTQKLTAYEVSA